MTMQAESLEVLEKASVPAAQARAIVRAIEIELGGAKDMLATKHDILLLRQDTKQDIQQLRQETREQVQQLRQETREQVQQLRQETREQVQQLRQEMVELRGGLEVKIHACASSITRQMYMALLGQMAVLLGIAYFFVSHVTR